MGGVGFIFNIFEYVNLAYRGFRFVYGTKAVAAATATCVCACVGECVCVQGVSRMVSWFSHATVPVYSY